MLLKEFRHRSVARREAAIPKLAALKAPPLAELRSMAEHSASTVERRCALEVLARRRDPAVPRLAKLALRDPGMSIRRVALAALARAGGESAAKTLAKYLRDESGGVRVLCAELLGGLKKSHKPLKFFNRLAEILRSSLSKKLLRFSQSVKPIQYGSISRRCGAQLFELYFISPASLILSSSNLESAHAGSPCYQKNLFRLRDSNRHIEFIRLLAAWKVNGDCHIDADLIDHESQELIGSDLNLKGVFFAACDFAPDRIAYLKSFCVRLSVNVRG